MEEVKCLEMKKEKFNDQIAWIREVLYKLEDFTIQFDFLEEFKDYIRNSLAHTKSRRCHLELMTAHTARMIPDLDSIFHGHEDIVV